MRDHPRGCGGTRERADMAAAVVGPSPRVRGNRLHDRINVPGRRTIPAGAGEPSPPASGSTSCWDHPRGCGGTARRQPLTRGTTGPSPRVRGNPGDAARHPRATGTIPAGAGEPSRCFSHAKMPGDHPRGCGGTPGHASGRRPAAGPSPRVRGNRGSWGGCYRALGTIPAGAGEPSLGLSFPTAGGDHPRGCGGTSRSIGQAGDIQGPSPRVRGNQLGRLILLLDQGTIPAGAGEPRWVKMRAMLARDHPRGCGGTGEGLDVRVAV